MSILKYFDALERLSNGTPLIVPVGTKISNDSVALEAGCRKGAIKKSRPEFQSLIEAINLAAKKQNGSKRALDVLKLKLEKLRSENYELNARYRESINREILLHKQLLELENKLIRFESAKVSGIRKEKALPS